MIQQQSILKVSDNSGAKTAKCIKVIGGFNKKSAKLGDIVVVSVQKLRNKAKITSKVKKGEVYKALIIRTRAKHKNKDGIAVDYLDYHFKGKYVERCPIGFEPARRAQLPLSS